MAKPPRSSLRRLFPPGSRLFVPGALLALPLLLAAAPAAAQEPASLRRDVCLHLDRITAFAPRGEVYVQVRADCAPEHFVDERSRLAYVEVLASDLPPVGEDVRVFEEEPKATSTLVFEDLSIASGDVVLVRLVRFGEILALQSVQVP